MRETRKTRIIHEALETYERVMGHTTLLKDAHALYKELWREFDRNGWIIRSGAEKFVAIKGSVVAKWGRKNNYSLDPIGETLRFYDELDHKGLRKLRPRVYATRENLIVEQRCRTVKYQDMTPVHQRAWDDVAAAVRRFANDIHEGNIGWVGDQAKVFDALMYDRVRGTER